MPARPASAAASASEGNATEANPQTAAESGTLVGDEAVSAGESRDGTERPDAGRTRTRPGAWAGLLLSLGVHAALLTAMALVVFHTATPRKGRLITVISDDGNDDVAIESLVTMDSPSVETPPEQQVVAPPAFKPDLKPIDPNTVGVAKADVPPSGQGKSKSPADPRFADGGFRLKSPENAVRRGAFTAWTIPIAESGEEVRPGQSPRAWQPYHIVIELRLPSSYREYPLYDLNGTVEGSDTYRQLIPKTNTFYYNRDGKLTVGNVSSRVPVRDGTVQVLVEVPGAAQASTQDVIEIRSKRLREAETLTIQFATADAPRSGAR